MLEAVELTNVMLLDIETVPAFSSYQELPEEWKKLWDQKSRIKYPNISPSESYKSAGIYAEFGKIICISTGTFVRWGRGFQLKIKTFTGDDEKKILEEFKVNLDRFIKNPSYTLAAHNGREFDFPYIARRTFINGLELPPILDIGGRRPWEINLIDTMDVWKFGDIKSYTSLNLIAACLGIPTPKDDIDGSMVCDVYYKEKNLDRIKTYCQKDVITLGKLIIKLKRETDLTDNNVQFI